MSGYNRSTKLGLTALCVVAAHLGGGCGSSTSSGSSSGSSGGSGDWYYHWSCNGDSECLSLGPGANGQASGTLNQGPVYANCSALLTFASKNWNIPPATNSCDHSSSGDGSDGGAGDGGGSGDGGSGSAKRVFVTNILYTGALGGLAGADAKCNLAAKAAALGGTWTAWLSDSKTDAIDRIAGSGPWVRIDGMVAFNNRENLKTAPLVAINVNENGVTPTVDGVVWTGTKVGGTKLAPFCADWTSESGNGISGYMNSTSGDWTAGSDVPGGSLCGNKWRLDCFEQ